MYYVLNEQLPPQRQSCIGTEDYTKSFVNVSYDN